MRSDHEEERAQEEALKIMRDLWSKGFSTRLMERVSDIIKENVEKEVKNGSGEMTFLKGKVKGREEVLSGQGRS